MSSEVEEEEEEEGFDNPQLSSAASSGDFTLVQNLVEQWQAQLSPSFLTPKHLQSAMAAAVTSHRPSIVSYLLDQGALVSQYDTLLALSDTDDAIAMFQTFLDHGWDINCKTDLGVTVLKHVIRNETLTRFFLTHGADPNFSTTPGSTILDVAAANSTPVIFDLLISHGAKLENSDALHSAAGELQKRPGRVEMLKHLLDMGMDINALWRREYPPGRRMGRGTPLHAAVSSQEKDRIVLLLERGADAQAKNTLGQTPMRYADVKGLRSSVEALREYENLSEDA